MPHERFFVDAPLLPNTSTVIDGQELHHLVSVMRLKVGDCVELVNGKDVLAEGTITALKKDRAQIHITSCSTTLEPKPYLILAQAMPRFQRLETVLEKGTELGAHAFWLFPGMLSEKETLSPNQHRRMDLLIAGAVKQCGRLSLPQATLKPPLLEWKPLPGALFFGDLEGQKIPTRIEEKETIILFIGPEKGWSLQEKKHLTHVLKAQPILLGNYTLRTDTAALASLALFSALR